MKGRSRLLYAVIGATLVMVAIGITSVAGDEENIIYVDGALLYKAYDINMDGVINDTDKQSVMDAYGEEGDPGWIREDINDDGKVNLYDASSLVNHLGETYDPYEKSTIQYAINNSEDGDTIYVYSGTYKECLTIRKPIKLIGEGKDLTHIVNPENSHGCAINILSEEVEISDLSVDGKYEAISVLSSNVTIHDVDISAASYGISILGNKVTQTIISNTKIYNCKITGEESGIGMFRAENNSIYENEIFGSYVGLNIDSSNYNNKIYQNIFRDNIEDNVLDSGTNIYYGSGGNYYDDYTGYDLDGDGIGDTPYDIPLGDNQDTNVLGYFNTVPAVEMEIQESENYDEVSIRCDLNKDYVVDELDIDIFYENYGEEGEIGTLTGDIDLDGDVDVIDASFMSHRYGYTYEPDVEPGEELKKRCDLNNDCIVDETDISILQENYGEEGEIGQVLGDVDLDGDVDVIDASCVVNNKGYTYEEEIVIIPDETPDEDEPIDEEPVIEEPVQEPNQTEVIDQDIDVNVDLGEPNETEINEPNETEVTDNDGNQTEGNEEIEEDEEDEGEETPDKKTIIEKKKNAVRKQKKILLDLFEEKKHRWNSALIDLMYNIINKMDLYINA